MLRRQFSFLVSSSKYPFIQMHAQTHKRQLKKGIGINAFNSLMASALLQIDYSSWSKLLQNAQRLECLGDVNSLTCFRSFFFVCQTKQKVEKSCFSLAAAVRNFSVHKSFNRKSPVIWISITKFRLHKKFCILIFFCFCFFSSFSSFLLNFDKMRYVIKLGWSHRNDKKHSEQCMRINKTCSAQFWKL